MNNPRRDVLNNLKERFSFQKEYFLNLGDDYKSEFFRGYIKGIEFALDTINEKIDNEWRFDQIYKDYEKKGEETDA